MLSIFTMAAISVLCITARFDGDPILLALLLSYSLTLQACVVSLIRLIMDIETRMVNVDRCFALLKVPQEYIEGDLSVERFKELNPSWPQ